MLEYKYEDTYKVKIFYGGREFWFPACIYCGSSEFIGRDHILPHLFTGIGNRVFEKGEVVPCCRECNTLKGSKMFGSVEQIARYLADRLMRRYEKILGQPDWEDKDLVEMSEDFRRSILATIEMRKWIADRIDHLILVSTGYIDIGGYVNAKYIDKIGKEERMEIIEYIDTFSAGLATMLFHIDHRLAGRIATKSVWKDDWLEYLIFKEERQK